MRLLIVLCLMVLAAPLAAKNRLAGESSPYLRQHADNPVDWYPWGEEALEKARSEGKLIFVSIGYASCHWCHVMEEESFENPEIAGFLNRHFVSIKIDRERRPDLDEQFIIVTSALTGSSGWPNSVFLTPEAAPFYAGTYFPPDYFLQILQRIVDLWDEDSEGINAQAAGIAERLRAYFDQTATLGDVTGEQIHAAATSVLGELDEFNGGFGTAPKFPQENLLLFLLDQARRHGDRDLLRAVTLTLDGMVRGGIHDHLGGGFHRYGTDPEWNIPHFEKMLYNQALIGRLLVESHAMTGDADYSRAAIRGLDYVLRDMRSDGGAFFAAQDADSLDEKGNKMEGAFYLWTPAEVRGALGDGAGPVLDAFALVEHGPVEGRNVLHLAGPPLASGISDAVLERLRQVRGTRPAPVRDEKIIVAWNAEMIVTLAQASKLLHRPDYAAAAVRAAGFMVDEMWRDDGLHRIWFDGNSDTLAQLTDYAALGRAFLALHDHGGDGGRDWLALADRLAGEMQSRFGDDGRAMRMNATAQGLGPFRPLDDNEVAAGNAQALAFLAGLDLRRGRAGEAAPRLAAVLAGQAVESPWQRAATLVALEQLERGATGPFQVSGGDAARVFAWADREAGVLNLRVSFRKGWHVNAHEPLDDYLIGTELKGNGTALNAAAYPRPITKQFGFSETPLAVYEKPFVLSVPLAKDGFTTARLTLQACSDALCQPPDDMVFRVWSGDL